MLIDRMRAWRLINLAVLVALLYLGIAWLTSIPPFAKDRDAPNPIADNGDGPDGDQDPKKKDDGTNGNGDGNPTSVPVTTRSRANALQNASVWLIQQQRKDGSWGEMRVKGAYGPFHLDRPGFHQAGPTAVTIYALLKTGMKLRHPAIRKGFAYLEKHHIWPATTPETCMVLMAVTATASQAGVEKGGSQGVLASRYRKWAQDLVSHLIKKRTATGWRYNYAGRREPPTIGGREDIVSTHLAAMALLSAYNIGIKIEDEVWLDILRYTLSQQERESSGGPDGPDTRGFAYILGHPISDDGNASGGATACGIANVLISRFVLTERGAKPQALAAKDAALPAKAEKAIQAATAWLVRNWSAYETPGKAIGSDAKTKVLHHHWLWALETAMDLNPLQPGRLGTHSWYTEVAGQLIGRQHDNGFWHNPGTWEPAAIIDTALAILVLERASLSLMR